jgi:Cu-Zn family superoxide dismutase
MHTHITVKQKKHLILYRMNDVAVAVIKTKQICGEIIATNAKGCVKLVAHFTKLPPGKHGFHIHKAGDLRGEGCKGLCEHYDVGHHSHGGAPKKRMTKKNNMRHTGDLGNICMKRSTSMKKTYFIRDTSVKSLWGRSIIVHADEDDLGKGHHDDSNTTGHSGKRIGCAIFGRGS